MITGAAIYFLFNKPGLVSFFGVFIPVIIVITTVIPVIPSLVIPVISGSKIFPVFADTAYKFFPVYIGAMFYERTIIELQLPFGNRCKLRLDIIIVHQFLMPVTVSKLHVVCNSIGKPLPLVTIFFLQCFINNYLNIFSEVIISWIPFGI